MLLQRSPTDYDGDANSMRRRVSATTTASPYFHQSQYQERNGHVRTTRVEAEPITTTQEASPESEDEGLENLFETLGQSLESLLHRHGWSDTSSVGHIVVEHNEPRGVSKARQLTWARAFAISLEWLRHGLVLFLALWCGWLSRDGTPTIAGAVSILAAGYYTYTAVLRWNQNRLAAGKTSSIQFVFPIIVDDGDDYEGDVTHLKNHESDRLLKVLGPGFRWNDSADGETALVWTMTPAEVRELVGGRKHPSRVPILLRLGTGLRWLLAPDSILSLLCLWGFVINATGLSRHWQGYNYPSQGVYRVWNAIGSDLGYW